MTYEEKIATMTHEEQMQDLRNGCKFAIDNQKELHRTKLNKIKYKVNDILTNTLDLSKNATIERLQDILDLIND